MNIEKSFKLLLDGKLITGDKWSDFEENTHLNNYTYVLMRFKDTNKIYAICVEKEMYWEISTVSFKKNGIYFNRKNIYSALLLKNDNNNIIYKGDINHIIYKIIKESI